MAINYKKNNLKVPFSANKAGKSAYFPHSGGGFHADKSISDFTLGRQFLTTKYFVVN